MPAENFSGAAPKASIIVVKLKEAKSYLREFYQYPPQAQVFQENDIMLGVSFAVKAAREMGMPVSVCLGLGSSQGAHIGDSELSRYLNYINEDSQVSVSVAAGNEGARSIIIRQNWAGEGIRMWQSCGSLEGEQGFSMECWGRSSG